MVANLWFTYDESMNSNRLNVHFSMSFRFPISTLKDNEISMLTHVIHGGLIHIHVDWQII